MSEVGGRAAYRAAVAAAARGLRDQGSGGSGEASAGSEGADGIAPRLFAQLATTPAARFRPPVRAYARSMLAQA